MFLCLQDVNPNEQNIVMIDRSGDNIVALIGNKYAVRFLLDPTRAKTITPQEQKAEYAAKLI